MYMPSIFEDMDGFFNEPVSKDDKSYRNMNHRLLHRGNFNMSEYLKTDVKENDREFDLTVSVPGTKKEDIKVELNEGYLTISAETSNEHEDKDDKHYIRRERFLGSASRSFYVGDSVKEDDIKAKLENGILKLTIPKIDKKPEVEHKKYVNIE